MHKRYYRCEQCSTEVEATLFDPDVNLCQECIRNNSLNTEEGNAALRPAPVSISEILRLAVRSNIYGYVSFVFSLSSIGLILFLLPTGMKHLEPPAETIFGYAFVLSIILGILGILFGVIGKRASNNFLARKGFLLGIIYFLVVFGGFFLIALIFSGIH